MIFLNEKSLSIFLLKYLSSSFKAGKILVLMVFNNSELSLKLFKTSYDLNSSCTYVKVQVVCGAGKFLLDVFDFRPYIF